MLTGKRVSLRAPAEGDLDALYEIAAEIATWEERSPSPPRALPRAEFAERYTKALAQGNGNGDVSFVIEVAGDVVGRCDLFDIDTLARSGEVGIALLPSARGKGYGTDALRVLVQFAFVRRNLHRVHLSLIASNAGAIGCYGKVGFVEEGRRRESAWVRGDYQDEIVMGLLQAEWQA